MVTVPPDPEGGGEPGAMIELLLVSWPPVNTLTELAFTVTLPALPVPVVLVEMEAPCSTVRVGVVTVI